MCRLPLLPLLALAALLSAPQASEALSCYQCEDPFSSDTDHPALSSTGLVPLCSEFDSGDDKFKVEHCQAGYDKTCAKISYSGKEKRGCLDNTIQVGCTEEDGVTFCACTTDYCNSAGLTAPALLLLLPAALLAAVYTA